MLPSSAFGARAARRKLRYEQWHLIQAIKASAEMTAKDSAVTVTSIRNDSDGSCDVLGTKAGTKVMFDVTADLATITQNTNTGR